MMVGLVLQLVMAVAVAVVQPQQDQTAAETMAVLVALDLM
jgi:hypothetical protein